MRALATSSTSTKRNCTGQSICPTAQLQLKDGGHGIQGIFSIAVSGNKTAIWIMALWQADVLRLAQFFTAPLLNSDAADRELEVWLELEVF